MPWIHAIPNFVRKFNHTADLLQVAVHHDISPNSCKMAYTNNSYNFVKIVRVKTNF